MLIALRLLFVWFGAASAALWIANRLVLPIRARVAVFLAFIPFLLLGNALVTGRVYAPIDIAYTSEPLASLRSKMKIDNPRTPLLSDVVYQEIPWRKAVREAVKNGRLPLWNRFILAGEPLLAVQQPVVLHPATWIGFLLPLAQAWTFEMAFGLFLAALCAHLFLREIELDEVPACLGAVAWAFSDYLRFWAGYPLTPAAAPFPLLLLGLRRLARRQDRGSAALTVVSLVLITVAGHSETLLHCVAAGGLYFLFELASVSWRQRLRAVWLSMIAGVLTLGLCATLLFPLAEALPQTFEYRLRSDFYAHAQKSLPLVESFRQLEQFGIPYVLGVSGQGLNLPSGGASIGYVGTLVLVLALGGLLARFRERWIFLGFVVLGLAIWTRVPLFTDTLSSLPLFDIAINERLVFVAAFGAAALAAMGAQQIGTLRGSRALAFAGVALAAALIFAYVHHRPKLMALQMPVTYLRSRFLLQLVPLLVLIPIAISARRWPRAGAAILFALVLVQRSAETTSLYPTIESRAFYPSIPLLDRIPRNLPERFTAVGYTFIPNISALYELEDVRGYEAMTFRPFAETYSLWCVNQPVWFNRVDDPTKPFLSFLNVRYVLAPRDFQVPPGWKLLARDQSGVLLENPLTLPRVFVPELIRFEQDPAGQVQVLRTIDDFRKRGVVEGRTPSGSEWSRNGQAEVLGLDYRSDEVRLEVVAREAALLATSVTAWPGWRLTIDGVGAPLSGYNRAFLAFRVPPGRHHVRLAYRPRSVVLGFAISAVTLIIALGLVRLKPSITETEPER